MRDEKRSYQALEDEIFRLKQEIDILKLSEKSDKISNTKYQKMIGNIGDVIVIIDSKGNNKYKSPNIEKYFGWKPEDVLGKSAFENVHADDLALAKNLVETLLSEPDAVRTIEIRYRCKDGSYKWIEFTGCNLLHDPDINGLLGNYHDITERKLAEDLLKRDQQFIDKIFNSLPGIFYLYTYPELQLVLWNKNHETLLGYEAEEIKNRYIMDWHIPEAKAAVQEAVDYVMEAGHNILESPLLSKDGKYIPFLMTGVRFDTPEKSYLMGIGIDISEKKITEQALKESEANLNSLINNRAESIWSIDKNYNYIIFNNFYKEAYFKAFNIELRRGMNSLDILTPELLAFWKPKYDKTLTGEKVIFEFDNQLGNKTYSYEVSLNPILSDGKVTGVSALSIDITLRKKAKITLLENQNQLKAQNEEYLTLNEELQERNNEYAVLNEEIIIAKEKAEESDRLKTAFLQNMSHEIRTPMNAIMGFADLLSENFNDKPKLTYFSNIISQRCSDLLDIINDVLDIAKIESGQLPVSIENCNIDSLFAELKTFFTEHQVRMNKQHISFDIMSPSNLQGITIATDKVKLRQIFINLFTNAFKFTNKGRVNGGCKLNENNQMVFFVSDTGIGIPPDKHQYVFERFTQVPKGESRLYGGTGLGLPIVKGLVGLLGGNIWLESEPDKGTTFYFTIAFDKHAVTEILHKNDEPVQEVYHFPNKTLLIVEDDPFNMSLIEEILNDKGLRILHAVDGKSAIEVSHSQTPDLVLMDIGLPDMSGYDVIHQILTQQPSLKIVAQTAYATSEDRYKAINSGCIDYISKPLKAGKLLSIINKCLL